MEPQALFFQFEADDRTRRICRFMRRRHISCVFVERPDYLQTLGALAALPGFAKTADYYMGAPLADEMLVLCGWTGELLDEFLLFMRSSGLPPVSRKAMLTPVNSRWSVLRLFEELDREHCSFRR